MGLSIKSPKRLCEISPFSKTQVCTFVQTHQIVKIVLCSVGKLISVLKAEGRRPPTVDSAIHGRFAPRCLLRMNEGRKEWGLLKTGYFRAIGFAVAYYFF